MPGRFPHFDAEVPDICRAARRGDTILLRDALDRDPALARRRFGAFRQFTGWTLLMEAAEGGGAAAVELLAEAGADVNAWSDDGGPHQTALMIAARRDNDEAVGALIRCGADLDAHDPNGIGALHRAVARRSFRVISMLRDAGAALDSPSVLASIVLYGDHVGLLQFLLKDGSDVVRPSIDAVDATGRTPLMIAAHHARHGCIQFLVEHGADRRLRDTGGRTALDHYEQRRAELDLKAQLPRSGVRVMPTIPELLSP